jgi:hypothetical protein
MEIMVHSLHHLPAMHEDVSGSHDSHVFVSHIYVDQPLAPSTTQNSAANVAETHLARAAAVRNRLKLATPSRAFTPNTHLSTNVLLHHEHGGGSPGEQKIDVAWQVCTPTLLRITLVVCKHGDIQVDHMIFTGPSKQSGIKN